MTNQNPTDVAGRYFVTDISSANIPASRLRNILDSLHHGRQLSNLALAYLQQQGLVALQRLALGEMSYEAFCKAARLEQAEREQAAMAEMAAKEEKRRAEEEEQRAKDAARAIQHERNRALAEQARLARESDPKYVAKVKNQQLRARYGLGEFIEEHCVGLLMDILRRVDGGERLTDDDTLWLKTDGKDYFTAPLQAAFHEREADFYFGEYSRTRDPWMAVNASGHYRKCDQARMALDLLATIPDDPRRAPKLKSAICTTKGGVMRDLMHWEDALRLGAQAHDLMPKDFRPCTLLGAVNVEVGNYDVAREWYAKAVDSGATEHSIDSDLRGIFSRADKARREEIKSFLLREDPVRYRWVHNVSSWKSSPNRV